MNNYNSSKYTNKTEWASASKISNNFTLGENKGDLATPFIITKDSANKHDIFSIGDIRIEILETCLNLEWDSKTGLVMGKVESVIGGVSDYITRPIRYSGKSYGTIPFGGLSPEVIYYKCNDYVIRGNNKKYSNDGKEIGDAELPFQIKYDYWYY